MNENYLAHHGILGMKWGVRRYQNADGSYTEAGRKRYSANASESSTKSGLSASTKKKIAAAALAAGTIAVAAIYASKHPEAVKTAIDSVKDISVNKVGGTAKKGAQYISNFAKDSISGLKQGYKEGIYDQRMKLTNTQPSLSKETGLALNDSKAKRTARTIGNYAGQVKESYAYGIRNAPQKALEGLNEGLANAPKKVTKGIVEGAAIVACTKLMNDALGEGTTENYKKAYNAYNKKNKIGNFKAKMIDNDDDEDEED